MEQITSERSSVRSEIQTQGYKLESLMTELENLKNSSSEDNDNSSQISSVMAKINEVKKEISDLKQRDNELERDQREVEGELNRIEQQEQQTLADIQDSATRANQNIQLVSSFGGDYGNVASTAAGGFQQSLGQLSQAAAILGGSVASGAAGGGAGARAGRTGGAPAGASRNFYEAANEQRNAHNPGALGARAIHVNNMVNGDAGDIGSASFSDFDTPKKSGGLGRKGYNPETGPETLDSFNPEKAGELAPASNSGSADWDSLADVPFAGDRTKKLGGLGRRASTADVSDDNLLGLGKIKKSHDDKKYINNYVLPQADSEMKQYIRDNGLDRFIAPSKMQAKVQDNTFAITHTQARMQYGLGYTENIMGFNNGKKSYVDISFGVDQAKETGIHENFHQMSANDVYDITGKVVEYRRGVSINGNNVGINESLTQNYTLGVMKRANPSYSNPDCSYDETAHYINDLYSFGNNKRMFDHAYFKNDPNCMRKHFDKYGGPGFFDNMSYQFDVAIDNNTLPASKKIALNQISSMVNKYKINYLLLHK